MEVSDPNGLKVALNGETHVSVPGAVLVVPGRQGRNPFPFVDIDHNFDPNAGTP